MTMRAMNHGSCLCGGVTWRVDAEPTMLSNCHCAMCRKLHGTPFATYGVWPSEAWRWDSGEALIRRFESSPGAFRAFCSRCGAMVPMVMPDGDSVFVPAGNLDGAIARPLDNHMFVGSKAPWFEISDGAPQFEGFPDGYEGTAVDAPARPAETPGACGGSCLCRAVTFELDEARGPAGYCHCSRCRRSRSAAHSAQTFVASAQFRWIRGQRQVEDFRLPEAEHFVASFCRICGAKMPTEIPDLGAVMVPLGALDQDPGIRPQAHIYVGSKAPWFTITDTLPQFDEMPPAS